MLFVCNLTIGRQSEAGEAAGLFGERKTVRTPEDADRSLVSSKLVIFTEISVGHPSRSNGVIRIDSPWTRAERRDKYWCGTTHVTVPSHVLYRQDLMRRPVSHGQLRNL